MKEVTEINRKKKGKQVRRKAKSRREDLKEK